jgi:hypothetical protein
MKVKPMNLADQGRKTEMKKKVKSESTSDFKARIRKLHRPGESIAGASHAHPCVVRRKGGFDRGINLNEVIGNPRGCDSIVEREYTVTFSREVAWENHKGDTCQVFAEDIADAVILGVETLRMESLIKYDVSDVRVIGVMEIKD